MDLRIGGHASKKPLNERSHAKLREKKCVSCSNPLSEMNGKTADGIEYKYLKCGACGEEVVDSSQLHEVANKIIAMKTYKAKITQWGQSLGLRIPKELVLTHGLSSDVEVSIVPDDNGFKIIPFQK